MSSARSPARKPKRSACAGSTTCPIDTARAVTYQHDLDKVHELLSRPGVRVDFAVDEAINTAAHLVSARWAAVDTVARVLQEQGRLSAIELYRLVGTPRARRRHG